MQQKFSSSTMKLTLKRLFCVSVMNTKGMRTLFLYFLLKLPNNINDIKGIHATIIVQKTLS